MRSSLAVILEAQKPASPSQRCPSSLKTIAETRAVGHPELLRRPWWCTRRWSEADETVPESPLTPKRSQYSIHTMKTSPVTVIRIPVFSDSRDLVALVVRKCDSARSSASRHQIDPGFFLVKELPHSFPTRYSDPESTA